MEERCLEENTSSSEDVQPDLLADCLTARFCLAERIPGGAVLFLINFCEVPSIEDSADLELPEEDVEGDDLRKSDGVGVARPR